MRVLHLVCVLCVTLVSGGGSHAQKPVVFKLAYLGSTDSAYGAAAANFANELARRTSGRYRIERDPAPTLGEREMIEAVQSGRIDLANVSTPSVAHYVSELRLLDTPFLFRDVDHARKTLDGVVGHTFIAKFPARRLIALAWTESGFRHLANVRQAIHTPTDVQGLRIVSDAHEPTLQALRKLGALPVRLGEMDLPLAFRNNHVDGEENFIAQFASAKLISMQKYVSLTRHRYVAGVMVMNPKLWASMPDIDKTAMVEAAKAAAMVQRNQVTDEETRSVQLLRRAGVQVVTRVDAAPFQRALQSLYGEWTREAGAEALQRVQSIK